MSFLIWSQLSRHCDWLSLMKNPKIPSQLKSAWENGEFKYSCSTHFSKNVSSVTSRTLAGELDVNRRIKCKFLKFNIHHTLLMLSFTLYYTLYCTMYITPYWTQCFILYYTLLCTLYRTNLLWTLNLSYSSHQCTSYCKLYWTLYCTIYCTLYCTPYNTSYCTMCCTQYYALFCSHKVVRDLDAKVNAGLPNFACHTRSTSRHHLLWNMQAWTLAGELDVNRAIGE